MRLITKILLHQLSKSLQFVFLYLLQQIEIIFYKKLMLRMLFFFFFISKMELLSTRGANPWLHKEKKKTQLRLHLRTPNTHSRIRIPIRPNHSISYIIARKKPFPSNIFNHPNGIK